MPVDADGNPTLAGKALSGVFRVLDEFEDKAGTASEDNLGDKAQGVNVVRPNARTARRFKLGANGFDCGALVLG